MASPVGAILFLHPFTLPISHFHFPLPFPTSISHFHFPLSFTTPQVATLCPLPYGCACALRPASAIPVPDSYPARTASRWRSAGNACSLNCRCSDIANLSAHLHRLLTPPPYLRPMRLLPGWDAGIRWQMMLLVVRGAVPANHLARESLF